MTHTFKCSICSRELSVSDKVFDERIAGKRVSVKCKHCNAPLTEEATSQQSKATSGSAEVTSPAGPSPAAKDVPRAVRAASHPIATKLGVPQRSATQSDSTLSIPAKAAAATDARRTWKPPPVTAQVKLSLAPVTAPPRPRQAEPPVAPNSNETRAAAPRPPSATSAPEKPTSTVISPASPHIATRPPLPVRANALDDIQKISVATPLSSKPPLPAIAIAPMRIVSIERGAASSQSPVATAPSSSAPPSAAVSAASAEASQSPSRTLVPIGSRHSESEVTPSSMTLAPDEELPRSSQIDMSNAAPKRFSKRKGARRMLLLGSAATLLIIALPLGFGLFKKGLPLEPANARPPSKAARAITQPGSVSMSPAVVPGATVAATPVVPTVVSPPAAPTTSPSDKSSSVASTSSGAAIGPKGSAASDDTIPDYVSKSTLILVTDVAIRRAQRCHPHGHATGSARLFMTFAPNGRVSAVRIEGEPVASAPVASCILGHARSTRIAKFEGEPFTYVKSITMR